MIETQAQREERRATKVPGLPKWAQQHIADLERKVADLERHVALLSEGPAESDTVVDGLGIYPDRELGQGVIIGFRLPTGTIEAAVRGGYLEVRDKGLGMLGTLVAQPQSSNVLRIKSDGYW
jgi:hypothetical protein